VLARLGLVLRRKHGDQARLHKHTACAHVSDEGLHHYEFSATAPANPV
jgi:hypothetical protein